MFDFDKKLYTTTELLAEIGLSLGWLDLHKSKWRKKKPLIHTLTYEELLDIYLKKFGVDFVINKKFDKNFSKITYYQFIKNIFKR